MKALRITYQDTSMQDISIPEIIADKAAIFSRMMDCDVHKTKLMIAEAFYRDFSLILEWCQEMNLNIAWDQVILTEIIIESKGNKDGTQKVLQ